MRIFAVSSAFPLPDQASGDLRFFRLLSFLARKHQLLFCAQNPDGTMRSHNVAGARLRQVGITLGEIDLSHELKRFNPDIVWFEFYHQARP